ncbi:MAG: hypothetical protein ACLUQ6_12855 [Alistipes onderdonkii]
MTADLALRASGFPGSRRSPEGGYGRLRKGLPRPGRDGPAAPERTRRPRQRVALLGGTDINYVMQDSPMDAKERPQNIVTFVSFREMDSQGQEETSQAIRIGGMDVLVNVDINNDVTGGRRPFGGRQQPDRPEGRRQPDLYHEPAGRRPPVGEIRALGRKRTLQSAHHLPKIFKITPDSYVEWIGNIADPAFNITAVETVRANASPRTGRTTVR